MTRKNVTLHDIARKLDISIGTVDRALNNRSGINSETKLRVLQAAKSLGYRPNLAARMLSSKKRLRISVNIPEQIASFWNAVRAGICEEANKHDNTVGIDLEFRTFRRFGEGEEAAFQQALDSEVDGILAATARPQQLQPLIAQAARKNIPLIATVTDAPHTKRLAVVSVDALASGAMAAELLARFVQEKGKLAVITGDLEVNEHAEKTKAFQQVIQEQFSSMHVLPPLENHEDEQEAREQCRQLLESTPDLRGIYISTANSVPVLQALRQVGLLGKITVIATDLFPELIPYIQSGMVAATLYQRPISQGHMAFRLLYDYLAEGNKPAPRTKLSPHLVMKSNLQFFQPLLSSGK